jgi:hypothetical protein
MSGAELLSNKYPRTFRLVVQSFAFWGYVAIYGGTACSIAVVAEVSKAKGVASLPADPIVRAIVIGVFIKALLRLNLYTLSEGPPAKVLGPELFTNLFLPHLLRSIVFGEDRAVKAYVQVAASKQNDLATLKKDLLARVPAGIDGAEKTAFERQVGSATSPSSALSAYLRFVGTEIFKKEFP